MSEFESFSALTDFIDANNIATDEYGNCYFPAIIQYKSPSRNATTTTFVKFTRTGYEDGKVTIDDNQKLPQDNYHLDFDPYFQKYKFIEDEKKLLIEGKSSKMSGKYSVEITYP